MLGTRSLLRATLLTLVLVSFGAPAYAESDPVAQPRTQAPARGDANFHKPTVGSCHKLSYAQAYATSDTRSAVPCSSGHTTLTVKVVELRDGRASIAAIGRCRTAMYRLLGGARPAAMTAYSLFIFFPTRSEYNRGARWVRCDLALLKGPTKLAAIPATEDLALGAAPYERREALCGAPVRGGHSRVSCAAHHSHVAKGTVKVRSTSYPSRAVFTATANRACARVSGSRRWLAFVPQESEWEAGNKYVVCLKPTGR